jgi:hypothetical protein
MRRASRAKLETRGADLKAPAGGRPTVANPIARSGGVLTTEAIAPSGASAQSRGRDQYGVASNSCCKCVAGLSTDGVGSLKSCKRLTLSTAPTWS